MRTGKLYIDGDDAYSRFGVWVVMGGYNELIAMPPLKSVTTNDWQEEDGVEADLSAPVLNTRTVSIKFAITGYDSRWYSFIEKISDRAYHLFEFAEIDRTYRLRLTSNPNYEEVQAFGTATLKFADDFPLRGYSYKSPQADIAQNSSYQMDGRNLTEYGVRILQGTYSSIVKVADTKQNLLRNIGTKAGAIYDDSNVTFKSKEAKLTCLMRAENRLALWRNWDALLYDLTRPDERTLYVEELEQEFPFYYKSCQVNDFAVAERPWLKFTLTIVMTGNFRINDDDFVLATEDGIIVFTEDGENAIEMLPDRLKYPTLRLVNTRNTLRLLGNGNMRMNN